MPCDTRRRRIRIDRPLSEGGPLERDQTVEERQAEVQAAVARLEGRLADGSVTVLLSPEGAVAFNGWEQDERDGVSDVCAALTLQYQASWAFTQALQAAEAVSGYSYQPQAVASGLHSHDGGHSWSTH